MLWCPLAWLTRVCFLFVFLGARPPLGFGFAPPWLLPRLLVQFSAHGFVFRLANFSSGWSLCSQTYVKTTFLRALNSVLGITRNQINQDDLFIDKDGNPTTPYQYSFQRKPSIANFRVFGCPCFFKRYEPTFRNKLITYKQQLQCVSRGIFIGFPENSAGWLVYSSEHPQRIVITRDAYFDEDFSSALAFDSKPFAGAIPIRSHLDPNGLQTSDNSEPSIVQHTGSAANLGHSPSTFIEEPKVPEQPIQEEDIAISLN